jgi:hypothetical protein
VEILKKAFGEPAGATIRLHGVAKCHLLEREKHAVERALLNSHGACRNLVMTLSLQ